MFNDSYLILSETLIIFLMSRKNQTGYHSSTVANFTLKKSSLNGIQWLSGMKLGISVGNCRQNVSVIQANTCLKKK